jgi:nitrogen regulatory protein PII-like uncharacterized protein
MIVSKISKRAKIENKIEEQIGNVEEKIFEIDIEIVKVHGFWMI